MTNPMQCPRCDEPHTGCAAHTRKGNPCRSKPMTGTNVCRMHGGSAPQVKAAALRRVALAEAHEHAQRMMVRAGYEADPIEHLLECLHRSMMMVLVYGQMVADLDHDGEMKAEAEPGRLRGWATHALELAPNGKWRTKVDLDPLLVQAADTTVHLHPFVREYHQALERTAKFAKLCLDAGVAERQVGVLEAQAELAQRALEATLEALGLDTGQRHAARIAFASNLRVVA